MISRAEGFEPGAEQREDWDHHAEDGDYDRASGGKAGEIGVKGAEHGGGSNR